MRDGLGCLASGGVLGRCVVGTVGGLGLPLTVVNRRAHVPHHGDSVCRLRCGLYGAFLSIGCRATIAGGFLAASALLLLGRLPACTS